jgi:hypothetical protein
MQANRYENGKNMGGCIKMILEDGFSGIVATLWAEGFQKKTPGKLVDGKE